MKKIYSAIIGSTLFLVSHADAQCTGGRYHDYIFQATPTLTSNVVYGSNLKYDNTVQPLTLDVYQPTGDVSTSRALVILCHAGSFLGGSKTGTDVVPLCQSLAKLGYVTASIEYRVGMTNVPFGAHTVDSADAGAALMRAVHDGRAAIRFFRKNAKVGGNTYKIDTTNIYFAGVSAGGIAALHIAYMDRLEELPTYIDTTGVTQGASTGQPGMHGGVEGVSGNSGYSSKVKAIINICGALVDTALMHTGDTPVLSFHGTNDGTVPYGSAMLYLYPPSMFPLTQVDGSSSVAVRANNLGIENGMVRWYGQDHIPEVGTSASAQLYYDSTITITRNFLEHFTCGVPLNCNYTTAPLASVNELANDAGFTIYPNPMNSSATVDLTSFHGNSITIALYDALGRQVKNIVNLKADYFMLSRNDLQPGIYFINLEANGKAYSKKIIVE